VKKLVHGPYYNSFDLFDHRVAALVTALGPPSVGGSVL
jgi:hypothetical protein